jgi:hypothetical protein
MGLSMNQPEPKADFMPLVELARLLGYSPNAVYAQWANQVGVLVPILTKLGGKVGCWREDYESFKRSRRRLPDFEIAPNRSAPAAQVAA